jgi:hypothetical protein
MTDGGRCGDVNIAALPAIADSPAFAPSSPGIRDGPLAVRMYSHSRIFSDRSCICFADATHGGRMTDEIMTIRRASDQFGLDLGEGALVNILGVSTKPFAASVAAIN